MTGGWTDYGVQRHANQETHKQTTKMCEVVHI